MRSIPDELRNQANKLHGEGAFVELWRITLSSAPTGVPTLFATAHLGEWDPSDPSLRLPFVYGGNSYYPFPMTRGPINVDSDGNLPSTTLALSNVTRELLGYLAPNPGLIGQNVSMLSVNAGLLGTGNELEDSFEWSIAGAQVTDQAIALDLVPPITLSDLEAPRQRFFRDACPFKYRDPLTCAYEGSIATCDRSLFGANGCMVHGNDEVANGRPRMHPYLYGGFPGLSRSRR